MLVHAGCWQMLTKSRELKLERESALQSRNFARYFLAKFDRVKRLWIKCRLNKKGKDF